MKLNWKDLGMIFSCDKHLNSEFESHAQSPQALETNNGIRVYFSTRKRESPTSVVSHVQFAQFTKDWRFTSVSSSPVIPLGEAGTFDEHGIFPFSVFSHNGRVLSYTCGWSRRSCVDVETATGLVESFDGGVTFERLGPGQIFGQSLQEPMLVGDSFVKFFDGIYHMWYMVGVKWIKTDSAPQRVYKLAHATSLDGIDWKPSLKRIIPDVIDENECQALPTVEYYNGIYHMLFCYRNALDFRSNPKNGYRIGYAWSLDLENWVREDDYGNFCSQDTWDSDMLCYPNLCKIEGKLFALYNGNQFGKAGFGLKQLDNSEQYLSYNMANKNEILAHLKQAGFEFLNALSERVDPLKYSEKLSCNASTLEVWDNKKLIGLLAYYHNKSDIYISNISVSESLGNSGLGTFLLDKLISVIQAGNTISLEVRENNDKALRFYKKFGFSKTSQQGVFSKLELKI